MDHLPGTLAPFIESQGSVIQRRGESETISNQRLFAGAVPLTAEGPGFAGLLIGGMAPGIPVAGIGDADGLSMEAIPEPSAAILGVFGAALLFRRRRK